MKTSSLVVVLALAACGGPSSEAPPVVVYLPQTVSATAPFVTASVDLTNDGLVVKGLQVSISIPGQGSEAMGGITLLPGETRRVLLNAGLLTAPAPGTELQVSIEVDGADTAETNVYLVKVGS